MIQLTPPSNDSPVRFGDFELHWDEGKQQLLLHHFQTKQLLWRTIPRQGWICASRKEDVFDESRGYFFLKQRSLGCTSAQTVDSIEYGDSQDQVVLSGHLPGSSRCQYRMVFSAMDDKQIQLRIELDESSNFNHIQLRCATAPDNQIFGFGEQLTYLNLKGRSFLVLSQEPGIGRGVQPLTWMMNTFFKAGGGWNCSNAPAPYFLTSDGQAFCLENDEPSYFDLSEPTTVDVDVFSNVLTARVFFGRNPKEIVEGYTRYCGRMAEPPKWLDNGAVIGMQGGTDAVLKTLGRLQSANAAIAGFWLQDWVGARTTSIGKQLWWNWELDKNRYPNWEGLLQTLHQHSMVALTYLNPFVVDVSEREGVRRNLYREAIDKGYVIKRQDGSVYQIMNTSFSAALLDLTVADCRVWIKEVMKEKLLKLNVHGWMADFGEALPFDAVLSDGSDPLTYHNRYPVEWAKLNREAIQEAGKEGEILFFNRAGYTGSTRHSTMFWMGDQLTSWSQYDGIKGAVIGLMSSGLSGISLNHGDIGGYISTNAPKIPFNIPFIGYARKPELLKRWIEMYAFTAMFRTHEGNQPTRHIQVDSNEDVLKQFAFFSRVYKELAPYRRGLFREAAEQGLPVVRHPWLVFPEDPVSLSLRWQFYMGDDVLVAPVLDPKTSVVSVYFPKGTWKRLSIGEDVESEGEWREVAAPLGNPAVYFSSESEHAELFEDIKEHWHAEWMSQ